MLRLRTRPGELCWVHAHAVGRMECARLVDVGMSENSIFDNRRPNLAIAEEDGGAGFAGPGDRALGKYRYNFGLTALPLYREIPGFMLNKSYAYLENRKRRKNSGLDFRHKLTSIFPSLPVAISGDFWAGPAAHSEASLGTPLPQGSNSYAINELDGEPTPSRGSTRPRLQGNHHVDFQRAGRRDQPLRQGKPGRVTTRCGNGGPGSPLHAREGTTVM